MLKNVIFVLASVVYYLLDYFVLNLHASGNTGIALIATIIDLILLAATIFLIMDKKKPDIILLGALIFPTTAIVYYAVIKLAGLSEIFKDLSFWQLLAPLAVLYILAVFNMFAGPAGPKIKELTNRGKNEEFNDKGKYWIDLNKDTTIPEKSRFVHAQIIGPTGSGKTYNIFLPWIFQDIMRGAGVFVFDIKYGEEDNESLHNKVRDFVIYNNRDTDYDRFCLGDSTSKTYNPLAGDDANEIFNRVFKALYYNNTGGETYYPESAERFLSSAIAVLKKHAPGKNLTFIDLFKVSTEPKKHLTSICNQLIEKNNDLNAKDLLNIMKDQNFEKDIKGLVNKISRFATAPWADQINDQKPQIDIAKILKENRIFVFQANSERYPQDYKALSVMLLMHIQAELSKRSENKKTVPFFLYLDEFADIVYPGFESILNKARSRRVGVIVGHQTIGDLDRADKIAPGCKQMILSNTRNKILLTIEDHDTANFFGNRGGTQDIEEKVESFSTKNGVQQAGFTVKSGNTFNVHPDKLKFLPLGEAYVMIPILEPGKSRFIKHIKFDPMPEIIVKRKLYEGKPHIKGPNTIFKGRDNEEEKPKPPLSKKLNMNDIADNAPKTIKEALKDDEESGTDKKAE
jgi:type IV secretory pathway TraG/TraD family ATPase VirD4